MEKDIKENQSKNKVSFSSLSSRPHTGRARDHVDGAAEVRVAAGDSGHSATQPASLPAVPEGDED